MPFTEKNGRENFKLGKIVSFVFDVLNLRQISFEVVMLTRQLDVQVWNSQKRD